MNFRLKVGICCESSYSPEDHAAWRRRVGVQINEVIQAVTDLRFAWHLDTMFFNWDVAVTDIGGDYVRRSIERALKFVEGSALASIVVEARNGKSVVDRIEFDGKLPAGQISKFEDELTRFVLRHEGSLASAGEQSISGTPPGRHHFH